MCTLMLSPKIKDSDSTSEYSDDDAVGQGRSEPESKPILSVRKCLYWEKKDISRFRELSSKA